MTGSGHPAAPLRYRRLLRLVTVPIVLVSMIAVGSRAARRADPVARLAPATGKPVSWPAAKGADFEPDVIYQVVLDRFFDGDPSNNDPPGDQGLYDSTKSNWKKYWGGDLAGLRQKLPYIAGMGVTAIWISPPVENVHKLVNGTDAGYHGYWARDFYNIDPHLGTWKDFDKLVAAAHARGIKIIVDFAANHSNPNDTGEFGSIYKDGVYQSTYNDDPANWFHHNGSSTDPNDQYNSEYFNLFDLADLAQENATVDSYLKGAMQAFLGHRVDGFRLDAVGNMPGPTGGWLRTLNDTLTSSGPHYAVGEWGGLTGPQDPRYGFAVRFANQSGNAILNYPAYFALDDVFALNQPISELDSILRREQRDFAWPNEQPNFLDNHDVSRFLTLNPNQSALHAGLAVTLTAPGIPIVYYGTEQYLHNDTNGGGDPYNRLMMTGFDQTTTAYTLIKRLAALRHSNPALGYGTYRPRWINDDVYVFERNFHGNVVVVAVNKSTSTDYQLAGLKTAMPAGTYHDYLRGLLTGTVRLTLSVGKNGAVKPFTLGKNQVAVWQYASTEPSEPKIGNVGPKLTHAGDELVINGVGFGDRPGSVRIGSAKATVTGWQRHSVTVTVPRIGGAQYGVTICRHDVRSACSRPFQILVDNGRQIPVTFTVHDVPTTSPSDQTYVSGSVSELGNWSSKPTKAIGPMMDPNHPAWFLMVSVPACRNISLKFLIVHADGTSSWEGGRNHQYTVPCTGTGTAAYGWQR
jgi:glycosidase